MNDYIVSATAADGYVRAYAATTRETVNMAQGIHKTTPVVTAALGRLMTAAVIMGSMLKGDEIVTCRIGCDGEISGLIATANAKGQVKGYPHNPHVTLPLNKNGKLDVAAAVGGGYLNVSKDLGLKEPYAGQIPLSTSEIAEDFAMYYTQSEQTPSAVALGVLVGRDYSVLQAGGLIIQLMPGAEPALADILTNRLSIMPDITTMLDNGKTPENILDSVFYDLDLKINKRQSVEFRCGCSFEKLYKVVIALGKEEIKDILEKDGQAVLKCHFCYNEYLFDEIMLKQILESCD